MSDTENEAVEQVDTADLPQVDPAEAKARSKGWVGLDEWTESGKNPDDWAPYKFFNEKGDMIGQIQQLKRQNKDFDSRLSQNNEYWKVQLDIQKGELLKQRDEAIEDADKEQVKNLDQQINNINQQQATITQSALPQIDPMDAQIETEYFKQLGSRAKQVYAQDVAAPLIAQGLSGQELVDAVNDGVLKEFPPQNSRRSAAPVTDSVKSTPKAKQDISIDNLSKEDKQMLTAMKSFPSFKGKSDAEILKSIEDSKK